MSQAFATDLDAFRQMMEQRYQLYFDATHKLLALRGPLKRIVIPNPVLNGVKEQ